MRETAAATTFACFAFLLPPLVAQQQAKPKDASSAAAQPDAELARIAALIAQANEQREAGQRDGARTIVREALAACLALPGLEDRGDAQEVLLKLGCAAYAVGEVRSAHDAWERVRQYRSRTLPEDHTDLQATRLNLAVTKLQLRDLAGARALCERVCEVWSRTLPDEHRDLQVARLNLALTKGELGDLVGARVLLEKVCTGAGHARRSTRQLPRLAKLDDRSPSDRQLLRQGLRCRADAGLDHA